MVIQIDVSPPIPALPKTDNRANIDVRYALIAPYASVHIHWDAQNKELLYELEEPILSAPEKAVLDRLESAMLELVNINVAKDKTMKNMIDYIDKTARLLIEELNMVVPEQSYEKLFYYLFRDFIGLNETEPMLRDYFIEDIECNGVGSPVYVVHRVYRNIKTNLHFTDVEKLAGFVEKLAQRSGKYVSYAKPILDGRLPDGSRVNATYTEDVTSKGPTFTIRKFTKMPWTPTQLIALNTLSPEMLAYFWILIQYKSNIFLTGGTASGKTTLLNAIAFFVPPEARVVSIEDSVTGDSKIIIKENEKVRNIAIKEFVDNKINAEVMTVDDNGKVKWTKPFDYIKHKVKKDIYEVTTSTGRKVKVTKDHSLFTLGDDNSLKEIKPTELKEKESFIAVPRVLPIEGREIKNINLMKHLNVFKKDFLEGEPISKIFEKYSYRDLGVEKERYRWWRNHNVIKIEELMKIGFDFSYDDLKKLKIKSKNTSSIPVVFEINKEFLEFCGLWLGDGSYDNYNENAVILSNRDKECRSIFKKVADYIGVNYSSMNDGEVSLRLHSTIFYKLMKNVLKFDGNSSTKKIPEFIFNLSNAQIKDFIRGFFSADGGMKKYEVSCSSQSYDLLEDLQSIFLRFGIISRMQDFNRKDKCISLSISSSENIEKFKKIGFLQERRNIKLNMLNLSAHHTVSDVIPLDTVKMRDLNKISLEKIQNRYLRGLQNMGRLYMQRVAPQGSEFNDLSHNDILWDKVRSIKKVSSDEIEVFDLSIPEYEKFLCNNIFVHNTRELNLPRDNWVPAVARIAIGRNVGEIDLFALLKNSFRQNPDYVVVGEVRGKEAFVLFQGMASGHPSISTMHSDSVDSMIRRLETPPIELPPTLVNSLDCVAIMQHAIVNNKATRRLKEITEIINVKKDGSAVVNTPFMWDPAQDIVYFKKQSHVFEKISIRYGIPQAELQAEFTRRAKLLYNLYKNKVFSFNDIRKVVNDFYKDPEAVYSKYGSA
jgi:type IV secretory pathway ATPase VirB11/archaellum biosynthesis ATPase/intein/homing endonuclease